MATGNSNNNLTFINNNLLVDTNIFLERETDRP